MKKWIGIVVALVMGCGIGYGASVDRLTTHEQANLQATHRVRITYADLTETSTNTAQTLSALFSVAARMSVEVRSMQLVTVFDTIDTNYTTSTALTVGDGTDPDLFLTSTELNTDGTEVWLKFGRANFQTAVTDNFLTNVAETAVTAVTGTTYTTSADFVTNVTYSTQILTNMAAYTQNGATRVTNIVVSLTLARAAANITAATASSRSMLADVVTTETAGMVSNAQTEGRKVYTADDYVDFTFTPNANEALASLSAGEVWIYINVVDARRPQ